MMLGRIAAVNDGVHLPERGVPTASATKKKPGSIEPGFKVLAT
jgi:hypothetical protein